MQSAGHGSYEQSRLSRWLADFMFLPSAIPTAGISSKLCEQQRTYKDPQARVSISPILCTFWSSESDKGDGNANILKKKKIIYLVIRFHSRLRWFLTKGDKEIMCKPGEGNKFAK